MRKKMILSGMAVCLSLFLLGCSYTKIEQKVKENIGQDVPLETILPEETTDDEIIYLQIGETLQDYYAYTDIDLNERVEFGTKGLEYIVNQVTAYDSFSVSGIDLNEANIPYENDNEITAIIENNRFVLIDLTVSYTNETGDTSNDSIIWNVSDFHGAYRWGDGYDEVEVDFPNKCEPFICFFDKHCNDGDIDMNGREMSRAHDYYTCADPIQSGESISFQIGLYCAEDFIKQKNLFLVERFTEPPSNDPIYYIDLMGRFQDE